MRILTYIFVFFSLIVPSLAQGEDVPESAVLMKCSIEGESDSWKEYKWETIDSEGVPSIFYKLIGSKNAIELIVDGEEHAFLHFEEWMKRYTEVKYRVTFYTAKRYRYTVQGKSGEISLEATYQVIKSQGKEKREVELFMENSETEQKVTDKWATLCRHVAAE